MFALSRRTFVPAVILGVVVMISCAFKLSGSQFTKTETKVEAKVAEGTGWTYSSDTDKMTSNVVYYGYVDADKKLSLKFPYEGSVASLNLKFKDNRLSINLRVSKGQILAAQEDGKGKIKVRFDQDVAEDYLVNGSVSHSSNIVFIKDKDKFMTNLKKSKKIIIAADFFDNGTEIMEFNTDGLVWNH